jgi:hypothetical protein
MPNWLIAWQDYSMAGQCAPARKNIQITQLPRRVGTNVHKWSRLIIFSLKNQKQIEIPKKPSVPLRTRTTTGRSVFFKRRPGVLERFIDIIRLRQFFRNSRTISRAILRFPNPCDPQILIESQLHDSQILDREKAAIASKSAVLIWSLDPSQSFFRFFLNDHLERTSAPSTVLTVHKS